VRESRQFSFLEGEIYLKFSLQKGEVVPYVGKALSKPGISKVVIFQSPVAGKIFAYSVDPFDATKVVREAADGTKRIGRVVAGKFKLS
jgi:hypothetical protein